MDHNHRTVAVEAALELPRTLCAELDRIMPLPSLERLPGTPFQFVSPIPLRRALLLTQHFRLDQVATWLHLSAASVKTYLKRYREEVGLAGPEAYQTALAWAPILTRGWDPRFRAFVHHSTPETA